MRVALYARVSTESQQARGTIGSQLAVLRERVGAEGEEVVAEFCDDGHSGARLDRPGLDALRDAAEAGLIERVWCLSADRLARVYAYQVIVLDELARHGVSVRFTDAPPLDDDPQAKLLTQVQGVIAEYERAKIAERYRRGPGCRRVRQPGDPAAQRDRPGRAPSRARPADRRRPSRRGCQPRRPSAGRPRPARHAGAPRARLLGAAHHALLADPGNRSPGPARVPGRAVDNPSVPSGAVAGIVTGLLSPRSRGSLRLRSADPAEPPLIDPAYLRHPDDMTRMIEATRQARRIARTTPLVELVPGPEIAPGEAVCDDAGLARSIRGRVAPYHHPVGTCAMGPDPDGPAVVDARGSVHGVDRLWVADASVMPTIPSAGTNLPTIVVAERIAAWLVE